MHSSAILLGVCALASAMVVPKTDNEVGHVIGSEGQVYQLEVTGHPYNVRVITQERKDGYYVHPIGYHVGAAYACNFYLESTRGVGSLIGEFQGPVDANFDSDDWAAFYECWSKEVEYV